MKQIFRHAAVFSMTAVLLLSGCSKGTNLNQPVPVDENVRVGKLENGMSYYIRHNQKPENRAEFFIVHNVGAVLENDDQNGLAHFTEHMAFNGTEHFAGKGIINFVQRHGMAFGRNLNAFTGRDQTAYMVQQIPLDQADYMIDSCLLILHDWSGSMLMTDEELDAERGVIHEEWRTRRGASFRMSSKLDPIVYIGSKYAKRDVIGDLDVIDNFEYQTIRDFYHKWYRPDLQAVILVGDFDVDEMETKVKALFSQIPAHENPTPVPTFEVENNVEPLIGIATDPEAQNMSFKVYYKHPNVKNEDKNLAYYRHTLVQNLYNTMINARLNELTQKENPPYIYAYNYYGSLIRTKDVYAGVASAKINTGTMALEAMFVENERLKRFGFTKGELERAKKDVLRRLEKSFNEKDKQENQRYVWKYFSNFLENEPMPSIDFEYEFAQKELPAIKLAELNKLPAKWITDENLVVTITGPEKEGVSIPAEADVKTLIAKVKTMELEPYEDLVSDKPLVSEMPKKSKVVDTKTDKAFDVTEWTLKNGAKVILKKTDFKADEILFKAFSHGGKSLVADEDLASADMASTIASMSGVGEFDNITLEKMLSGKIANVSTYISDYEEGLRGSTTPADLETFLQLIYLNFEQPRFDETAYKAYMTRMKAYLEMSASDPRRVFRDSTSFIANNRNMRRHPMNMNYLEKVELAKIKKVYTDRFKDASDFTFVFVGNVEADKMKPLVEQYIGGIADVKRKEEWKNDGVGFPAKSLKTSFKKDMETAKSSVYVNFNNEFDYNYENRVSVDAIRYILSMRYTETVREEQGGSYGVSVWVTRSKIPAQDFSLNMQFDCDPDKAKLLKGIIYKEVKKIVSEGPKAEDVNKTIEYFMKDREVQLKENRFWLNAVAAKYNMDIDYVSAENYDNIVKSLTSEKLQKAAAKLLKGAKNVEVVMYPTK